MRYAGRYRIFDFSRLETYPLGERPNILTLDGIVDPEGTVGAAERWPNDELASVAQAIRDARRRGLPVILFTGAHAIKLGFSPLFIDLMRRDFVTLLAGNGALSIHDFELALIGETSENVPDALPKGLFGMAEETGRALNAALRAGEDELLGYGEAVGRLIVTGEPGGMEFPHRDLSLLGQAYELGIPATIHVGIGTDIIDQHPSFDGAAKGGTSGRDFGIYTQEVARLAGGGVALNIGSAVTGPEVLLKAVSMAANVGKPPRGLVTANFDLRSGGDNPLSHPSQPTHYYRDLKSVVLRIPEAFGGRGHMIEGNFLDSMPALHDLLVRG